MSGTGGAAGLAARVRRRTLDLGGKGAQKSVLLDLSRAISQLAACAFYVTHPAKKPFIRPKLPICGLGALAFQAAFVFSRQRQLTHRPKSQARGL